MTDSASVFTDLDRFSMRLGTLLSSNAARQAPKVAQRLHAERLLAAAIDSLSKSLKLLADTAVKLDAPLRKVEHVAAGCAAIADSLEAFGDGRSLGQVAKLCGQGDALVQPIVDQIVRIRGPLQAALGLLGNLPTPDQLHRLHQEMIDLANDFEQLKPQTGNSEALTSEPPQSNTGGNQP